MTYPELKVEAAFTVGGAFGTALILDSATKGLLNTGTLSAEAWTDITAYARGFTVRRGATRAEGPVLRYEAGTLTMTLDNSDRRFDPANLSGPYVSAGKSQVTPMRAVRVRAVRNGTSHPIFRGYADSWDVSYAGPSYSECTLTATDAVKVLSNFDRVALGVPVGAGEDSGARVTRILDSVSWQQGSDFRVISVGDSTLQGTTLDRSAWEELMKVADSEIGHVYIDAAGRVVFRNRHALMEDARSATVQGAFGDGPDPSGRANLITNPSMESASGTTVVRTNLMPNPIAANDAVSWWAWGGTGGTAAITRQTGQSGWAYAVTTSARITWTTATTAVDGGINAGRIGTSDIPVTAGRTYGTLIQARPSKTQRLIAHVIFIDAGSVQVGAAVSSAEQVVAANTVATFAVTGTVAPTGAVRAIYRVQSVAGTSGTTWAVNDWLEATMAHFEETDQTLTVTSTTPESNAKQLAFWGADIFDPTWLSDDYTFGWAGTAHASASQQKAPALTNWSTGTDAVVHQSSDRSLYGSKSARIVWGTDVASGAGDGAVVSGLTVGQTYTHSRWVYVPSGSADVKLSVDGIGVGQATSVKDQWVRLSQTITATATTHTFRVVTAAATVRGDDVCYVDGVMLEVGGQVNDYTEVTLADLASGATDLPFVEADLAYDDTVLANVVRIANAGGSQQTAEDVASQQQYLVHTHERTDLILQTDDEAANYANFVLYQMREPELRFTNLTVRPHDDPDALFPQVLGRDFGDRISLTRRPPGGGTVTQEAFIAGVSHEVGGPNEWRTTWTLQSASKWSFLTLNHSTLGALDANALTY